MQPRVALKALQQPYQCLWLHWWRVFLGSCPDAYEEGHFFIIWWQL